MLRQETVVANSLWHVKGSFLALAFSWDFSKGVLEKKEQPAVRLIHVDTTSLDQN